MCKMHAIYRATTVWKTGNIKKRISRKNIIWKGKQLTEKINMIRRKQYIKKELLEEHKTVFWSVINMKEKYITRNFRKRVLTRKTSQENLVTKRNNEKRNMTEKWHRIKIPMKILWGLWWKYKNDCKNCLLSYTHKNIHKNKSIYIL